MIPNDIEERRRMIGRMLYQCSMAITEQNADSFFSDGLFTEWEENFIDSCQEQFDKNANLTDKQCEILERIYDKI